MPLEQELIDLMIDEVTLEPATGTDKYNNFVYDTPLTGVQCQVSRTNRRVINKEGREVISTVQIIFADPTLEIDVNTRLTLADGSQPAIIELLSASDETGPYYLEIRA